jgi:hypothetical protein
MREENTPGITPERLRELLDYDPETGEFTWRVTRNHNARHGQRAGSTHGKGYWGIAIDGRKYQAHRLAFLHIFGKWPDGDLDHANGVRTDNRIANLRLATRSQNAANRRCSRRNISSGFKGVHFEPQTGQYRARIGKHGKSQHLGLFRTAADAHAAYCAAAREVHGAFWRAG